MNSFPRHISKVIVPPIKCQGIKTKLVPFIAKNIHWDATGKWIEPFLGSGVVAFNMKPKRALLSDTNHHIIKFYQQIQNGQITRERVIDALNEMGRNLKNAGADYYYEVRNRFNTQGNSLDFLFLNRSCFNGLMRFNSKGHFNVPFGHKPNRFARPYITKIANQIEKVSVMIRMNDWEFKTADWKDTLSNCSENDFVYLDPPYIGRHADYFNSWNEKDAVALSEIATNLSCEFALSMWLENKYRTNSHIRQHWKSSEVRTTQHFYHVGSTESLRNSMTEALLLKSPPKHSIAV